MVAVQMGTYGSAKFSPMMNNMNNMINLLSIYDMMYLATSVYLFAILCQDMIGTYYVVSLPVVLPLAHIGLVGSIFSTPALSLEKYLAMVHPFTRYRYLIKPVGCPT